MLLHDEGDNYVPLIEDDDDSQAQPLPTQRKNVEDMKEMEVEDSMTNADIRSLMPIAGGSEDRSHAAIDTQARVSNITLPASTRSRYPMVSSSNGSSQALVRQYALLPYPPVTVSFPAVNALTLTDSNSTKLDC
ncbi:uncharacterized protein PHALS_11350 [Plasmopara halstedii]|uniref:Uncharacterized protein n=1 Tax=Plasmopara halstedii TaxID=4781 RepID=A0A0P1A5R7_PLAHL|nr:uncharacterized protein PHALS_11350 [Plasmopara halstedii]CEG35470.1 hypothetical protein PHALS_11350 [Plasmopara halstedii]|eukprot:XP_024571839.1 hypothetical protein PHALS_11350 [Plasmopara halstedii]